MARIYCSEACPPSGQFFIQARPLARVNQCYQLTHTDSLCGSHPPSSPHIRLYFYALQGNSINSVSLLLPVHDWHHQGSFQCPLTCKMCLLISDSHVNKRIPIPSCKWPCMICARNTATATEINPSWPYWSGHPDRKTLLQQFSNVWGVNHQINNKITHVY